MIVVVRPAVTTRIVAPLALLEIVKRIGGTAIVGRIEVAGTPLNVTIRFFATAQVRPPRFALSVLGVRDRTTTAPSETAAKLESTTGHDQRSPRGKTGIWYHARPDKNSASTGSSLDAHPSTTTRDTFAQAAEARGTEQINALMRRKREALTPYKPDAWEAALRDSNLSRKYPFVVRGLRFGFHFDFPSITRTQIPPNRDSIVEFHEPFNSNIQNEIAKSRYIGPFDQTFLEHLIGPFQTSPFSIIPKPNKPGKFRLIQNFSYPHSISASLPNPSINSACSAANHPCTWASFAVVSFMLGLLPSGSEIAIRDIAEAYRTIPLHPSEWPAAVIQTDPGVFFVDTCGAFGAGTSGGVYGLVTDASTDLYRARGIGPLGKWVDDHILARI